VAEVQVTIAGRKYRMACDEGQEDHLKAMGAVVDTKITAMREGFGEIGDTRLTVMASVVLADELDEARTRIAALEADVARLQAQGSDEVQALKAQEAEAAAAVAALAGRLEAALGELNSRAGGRRRTGAGTTEALD
jgi:cell division protein ZapA